MKIRNICFLVVLLIILLVYKNWFFFGIITSGDFGYLYQETIEKLHIYPYLWDTSSGSGLGGNISFILALNTFYFASAKILQTIFRFDWSVIARVVWFWPFLVISVCSSVYLYRKMFPGSKLWFISPLVFLVNTYSLMLAGGGQIGVAMGYAFAPLVLWSFMREGRHREVISGSLIALQVMFDPRMAFLTMMAVCLYAVIFWGIGVLRVVIPVGIAILLHFFWLLPLVVSGVNPIETLGPAYSSANAVKFLSFADFSHTLSLLQPNWPENIFGKSGFLQPEFLVIPVIALCALLFIAAEKKEKRKQILYFALIGLIGAFLAKGANPPFGGVYLWTFEHIPGFIMFRDPTKFYLFIAISYSILIPFALERIGGKKSALILVMCFSVFWGVAHRQAVMGQLGGTFISHPVPSGYAELKDYLVRKEGFSRILWVPSRSRYGFFSDEVPELSINAFGIASPSSFISWIAGNDADEKLRRYGVSHIVVPTDPKGELFVTDRNYDEGMRNTVLAALRASGAFLERTGFGNIAVFQTQGAYGHAFFADAPEESLSVRRIAPTDYEVNLPTFKGPRTIIFSESYDPHWVMSIGNRYITPVKSYDGLQQYEVPPDFSGKAKLRYLLQDYVSYGLWISGLSVLVLLGCIGYEAKKNTT